MGSHPVNLLVRFVLEVSALLAMGVWGWHQGDGILRILVAVGVPLICAILWGVFAVPGDPSRSGSTVIPIPGVLRLVLELAIFTFAVWTLIDIGAVKLCWSLGIITTVHYMISYDRLLWLLAQNNP